MIEQDPKLEVHANMVSRILDHSIYSANFACSAEAGRSGEASILCCKGFCGLRQKRHKMARRAVIGAIALNDGKEDRVSKYIMLSHRTYEFEMTSAEVNDLRTALRKTIDLSMTKRTVYYTLVHVQESILHRSRGCAGLTLRLQIPCL